MNESEDRISEKAKVSRFHSTGKMGEREEIQLYQISNTDKTRGPPAGTWTAGPHTTLTTGSHLDSLHPIVGVIPKTVTLQGGCSQAELHIVNTSDEPSPDVQHVLLPPGFPLHFFSQKDPPFTC